MTDWPRLAKLAGMLGSDYEHERANASRMLTTMLEKNGLTYADFAQRLAGTSVTPPRVVYIDREVVVYRERPRPKVPVYRTRKPGPVPEAILADLGLIGRQPRRSTFKRNHTMPREPIMPEATQDDIRPQDRSAWAARDLDLNDDDFTDQF